MIRVVVVVVVVAAITVIITFVVVITIIIVLISNSSLSLNIIIFIYPCILGQGNASNNNIGATITGATAGFFPSATIGIQYLEYLYYMNYFYHVFVLKLVCSYIEFIFEY